MPEREGDMCSGPTWFHDGFLGYGRRSAPLWIVGIEEHTEGDADSADRLLVLPGLNVEEDVLAAHARYSPARFPPNLLASMHQRVTTWKRASAIATSRGYNAAGVGTTGSDVFLVELLPLPKPKESSWPAVYHPLYPSLTAYRRDVGPCRARRLVTEVRAHMPRVVVLHGKIARDYVAPSIGVATSTVVSHVRNNIPSDVRVGTSGGTHWVFCGNLGGSRWSNVGLNALYTAMASLP